MYHELRKQRGTSPMHVVDMVYFWARTTPRRPAIIQPDGIITYRALAAAIEAAAEHFTTSIPARGKPVAVSIDSPPRMLVASLALFRAGFSVVPVSNSLFAHLPAADADTLVHARDGATLDGG